MSHLVLPRSFTSRATGAEIQATLMDGIRRSGGVCAHVRDSRRFDVVGLPDVIGCVNGATFWLEVKGRNDAIRPAQETWLDALRQSTERTIVEVVTWRNLDQVLADLGIEAW